MHRFGKNLQLCTPDMQFTCPTRYTVKVYQLIVQFPAAFEFSSALLLHLSREVLTSPGESAEVEPCESACLSRWRWVIGWDRMWTQWWCWCFNTSTLCGATKDGEMCTGQWGSIRKGYDSGWFNSFGFWVALRNRWGTFLGDCEKERSQACGVRCLGHKAWTGRVNLIAMASNLLTMTIEYNWQVRPVTQSLWSAILAGPVSAGSATLLPWDGVLLKPSTPAQRTTVVWKML